MNIHLEKRKKGPLLRHLVALAFRCVSSVNTEASVFFVFVIFLTTCSYVR